MLDKTCSFEYIIRIENSNSKIKGFNKGGPFNRLGVLVEEKMNKSTLSMD
jgi:hypothetical protein